MPNNPVFTWDQIESKRREVVERVATTWAGLLNGAATLHRQDVHLAITGNLLLDQEALAQFKVWGEASGFSFGEHHEGPTQPDGGRTWVLQFTPPERKDVSVVVELFPGRTVH